MRALEVLFPHPRPPAVEPRHAAQLRAPGHRRAQPCWAGDRLPAVPSRGVFGTSKSFTPLRIVCSAPPSESREIRRRTCCEACNEVRKLTAESPACSGPAQCRARTRPSRAALHRHASRTCRRTTPKPRPHPPRRRELLPTRIVVGALHQFAKFSIILVLIHYTFPLHCT